ncbi:hypothetical protein PT974_05039 [Cladobotryum mycophilum]|uniref:Uncharacterized protein n=1 Tax=Cladobotryum mycophilum TaxID=491253 RepID=A0ABR0SS55_9HYPO
MHHGVRLTTSTVPPARLKLVRQKLENQEQLSNVPETTDEMAQVPERDSTGWEECAANIWSSDCTAPPFHLSVVPLSTSPGPLAT